MVFTLVYMHCSYHFIEQTYSLAVGVLRSLVAWTHIFHPTCTIVNSCKLYFTALIVKLLENLDLVSKGLLPLVLDVFISVVDLTLRLESQHTGVFNSVRTVPFSSEFDRVIQSFLDEDQTCNKATA